MDELIQLLEHECDRLDHIRYRTSVAVLLVRGGETRFLPRAADEIHEAVDDLAHIELLRATVVDDIAAQLGIEEDELTLGRIITAAPAAVGSRLRELQERLRAALTELQQLTGAGTATAGSELESIRRSLGRWSGTTSASTGYGAVPSAVGPARFDGSF
jgi:hypothetical protein